jgi:anti-anti-sigma factor
MLKVNGEKLGSATVLHLEGRVVNGNETAILREAVSAEVGPSVMVLDLAKVEMMDAGGLGVLLELRGLVQSKGIEFRLMNVTQLVQQVLEIACLDSVFDISNKDMTPAAKESHPVALDLEILAGEEQITFFQKICA